MDNFAGYHFKIGTCTFNSPSPLRDKFKFFPEQVLVSDATSLANGELAIKVLPHTRKVIEVEFPPMTPEQFRTYWTALHSDSGGKGMFLIVEVWNEVTNSYVTDTFYHNDISYYNLYLRGGTRMIKIDAFNLIGH